MTAYGALLLKWPEGLTSQLQAIFAFSSQLRNEAAAVNDIHFVPGNPRTFMGGLAWYF